MSVMKVKLGMMVEYMRHWTPIADGPVYADQMERAISLMEIIIDWGGESEYAHSEDENDYFDAKHFSPYVNMRNRKRFPSPDYDGRNFWCKAQRVRFDKGTPHCNSYRSMLHLQVREEDPGNGLVLVRLCSSDEERA